MRMNFVFVAIALLVVVGIALAAQSGQLSEIDKEKEKAKIEADYEKATSQKITIDKMKLKKTKEGFVEFELPSGKKMYHVKNEGKK